MTKAGIKETSFRNARRFNKRKTFQAKNRHARPADTPVANLIKAKSTENTNLNRQYTFIDIWHFLTSDAKVGGWVGGSESLTSIDAN